MPKKKKTNLGNYRVSINVLGKTYTVEGDTVISALEKLNVESAKGKSILSVERNGIKKEKILMPNQTYRLLKTLGLSRSVAIKNVSLLFEGI